MRNTSPQRNLGIVCKTNRQVGRTGRIVAPLVHEVLITTKEVFEEMRAEEG
ncbi:hypothetical protein LSG25_08720 [Paralcaligenes sp. KSB-10]|jgi:hypothetical protein|uniref:hypothetical protein n=1 Tax=Paralcaligenes sp. KSB-10 TaxID=2901142 RepID=UPI001E409DAE|nr:hypothetical protein [Paralcaligenes sp. KSB-10]UHL65930.1 hypothetical protein LSG25_08720 [Paralcaligenes sp. KSB-10]